MKLLLTEHYKTKLIVYLRIESRVIEKAGGPISIMRNSRVGVMEIVDFNCFEIKTNSTILLPTTKDIENINYMAIIQVITNNDNRKFYVVPTTKQNWYYIILK